MNGSIFEGIWDCARGLCAFDSASPAGRSFRGFLEPLQVGDGIVVRKKPGIVSRERFRLIAEPCEAFSGGVGMRISCGGDEFELLAVREVFAGDEISHRECVLRKTGEAV
ncbi:MAG: hypothetical protein RSE64_01320 [Oscillospiraceae bacterium]